MSPEGRNRVIDGQWLLYLQMSLIKVKFRTVIVAVITSNLRLAEAPGNFQIPKKESGLSKESVVNVS